MNALKRYLANKQHKANWEMLEQIHEQTIAERAAVYNEPEGYCERHGIENSPEMYGCKPSVPEIYRLVSRGSSADCELSEMNSARVNATSHAYSEESLASPMPIRK